VQRQRFFFYLGVIAAAVMLIVASIAFGTGAVRGVGLGIGIGLGLVSLWFMASSVHHRDLPGQLRLHIARWSVALWPLLASLVLAVAVWEIVESVVFSPDPTRWLTLANGVIVAVLACGGLIAHELSSERIIHVLQVVDGPHDRL
jgi:hypothetical protein